MNNSLKQLIFGLAIIFGLQGIAAAEGDDMETAMDEITKICEQASVGKEDPDEFIDSCIDEHVEKMAKNSQGVESMPTEEDMPAEGETPAE